MWNFLDTVVTDIQYSYRGATIPDFFWHFLQEKTFTKKQSATYVYMLNYYEKISIPSRSIMLEVVNNAWFKEQQHQVTMVGQQFTKGFKQMCYLTKFIYGLFSTKAVIKHWIYFFAANIQRALPLTMSQYGSSQKTNPKLAYARMHSQGLHKGDSKKL